MTVYVDPIRWAPRNAAVKWPAAKGCHLVADSADELRRFAMLLGLRQEWLRFGTWDSGRERVPYFVLTEFKRAEAIRLGAAELEVGAFSDKLWELAGGKQGAQSARKGETANGSEGN